MENQFVAPVKEINLWSRKENLFFHDVLPFKLKYITFYLIFD